MSDDIDSVNAVLKRATEALRSETEAANLRSGLTRARVLDSASKRYASPRRFVLRLCVAVASVFVVGTALARVSEEWPALREVARSLPLLGDTIQAPAKRKPRAVPRAKPPAPVPIPVADKLLEPSRSAPEPVRDEPKSVVAEPVTTAEPAPRERSVPKRTRARALPVAQPAPVVAQPVASELTDQSTTPPAAAPTPKVGSAELVLFRRAQALHLAHDPAAALAAWDAYLRVAVHGVLVPEARYNRALCLVRLGRNEEARAALASFAGGAWNGYRNAEAKALLEALPR